MGFPLASCSSPACTRVAHGACSHAARPISGASVSLAESFTSASRPPAGCSLTCPPQPTNRARANSSRVGKVEPPGAMCESHRSSPPGAMLVWASPLTVRGLPPRARCSSPPCAGVMLDGPLPAWWPTFVATSGAAAIGIAPFSLHPEPRPSPSLPPASRWTRSASLRARAASLRCHLASPALLFCSSALASLRARAWAAMASLAKTSLTASGSPTRRPSSGPPSSGLSISESFSGPVGGYPANSSLSIARFPTHRDVPPPAWLSPASAPLCPTVTAKSTRVNPSPTGRRRSPAPKRRCCPARLLNDFPRSVLPFEAIGLKPIRVQDV